MLFTKPAYADNFAEKAHHCRCFFKKFAKNFRKTVSTENS